ncbi:hypothetical protein HYN56_19865 [Flavobacterium crocinum]|uniref:Uncharacterized protein n=1 Tax=Flavobacterium crocinum TaxID=2183896 RepID=A0A2S1YQH7_9FLAO|nr:hypothetical protein [Flavobacterium crocinum]AWK06360.1 hypothetical protein HYN56_19865 [Flavobacterium crocinum]
MKLVIERTLFGFNDGIDSIKTLDDKFTPLSILMNRLLSDKYNGKKIKYLNLFFYESSEKLQKAYGKPYFLHYYGGQFTYKKVIDYDYFLKLDFYDQKLLIWKEAYDMLQFAAAELKNESLKISSDYAYRKGLEMKLCADYRMVETDVVLFGEQYRASIWVNFKEFNMEANFTLERNDEIVLKRHLETASNGMEFFLVMFRKIEQLDNAVVIKGVKDLIYLPLQIDFVKNGENIEFSELFLLS